MYGQRIGYDPDAEMRPWRRLLGAVIRQAVLDARQGQREVIAWLQEMAGGEVDLEALAMLAGGQRPRGSAAQQRFEGLLHTEKLLTMESVMRSCSCNRLTASRLLQQGVGAGRLTERRMGRRRLYLVS